MRSKYGMVTNLFSTQRYDFTHVFGRLVWCPESHEKFSRDTQSHTVDCVKHNFWTLQRLSFRIGLPRNCVLRTRLCDFEGAEKIFCEVLHTELSFAILVWDHTFAQKKVS